MRRTLLAMLCFSPGCATSLAAGANTGWQSNSGVTQEATFAAAAGLGDSRGAFLTSARGAIGVDVSTGARTGGFLAGYEYLYYGGDFDTVATGSRVGLFGGVHTGARGDDFVLAAEYGHHFVLDRAEPRGGMANFRLISLSLAPMFGVALPLDKQHGAAAQASLNVTLRVDDFSSWKFHF